MGSSNLPMRYFRIVVVVSAAAAAATSVAVVYFTLNYAKETSIQKKKKNVRPSIVLGVAKCALKYNEQAIK